MIAALALLGCEPEPEPAAPYVEITSPADESTVCGNPLAIELVVENFELVDPADDPGPGNGHGHIDVFLNGQSAMMASTTSFQVDDVADGLWQLKVELVNADHTAVEPYAGHLIYVTVDNATCGGSTERPIAEGAAIRGVDHATMGTSVAVADGDADGTNDVLAGAMADDEACVWRGPVAGSLTVDDAVACWESELPSDLAGYSAAALDATGDGTVEWVVGAVAASGGGSSEAGAVYVLSDGVGVSSLGDGLAVWRGEADKDHAGWSVANVGDVSGDGAPDLAIGAPDNDDGGDGAGLLYVWYPPIPTGERSLAEANLILQGGSGERHASGAPADVLGLSVAGGDTNADGVSDLLVSAGGHDWPDTDAGRALLIEGPFGNGRLGPAAADASFYGTVASGYASEPVASGGDLDGDGTDDVVLGVTGTYPSAVYVFFRDAIAIDQMVTSASVAVLAEREDDRTGDAIAIGDADLDGNDDLLVAAPYADDLVSDVGAVYVVPGPLTAGSLSLADAERVVGSAENDRVAQRLLVADTDGDGADELVAGAAWTNTGDGAVFILDW